MIIQLSNSLMWKIKDEHHVCLGFLSVPFVVTLIILIVGGNTSVDCIITEISPVSFDQITEEYYFCIKYIIIDGDCDSKTNYITASNDKEIEEEHKKYISEFAEGDSVCWYESNKSENICDAGIEKNNKNFISGLVISIIADISAILGVCFYFIKNRDECAQPNPSPHVTKIISLLKQYL